MADFPALPLFTDSFLADCNHLTDAEMGLYLRLLILIWRTPGCRIPNDPLWISRKLCRSPELVDAIIKEFCESDGNFITQKRLFKEFCFVKKMSRRGSVNAKHRWNKENVSCQTDASLHPSGNAPTPTPTPTPLSTSNNNKKDIIITSIAADDKSSSPVRVKKNDIIFDFMTGTFAGYHYMLETWKNAYPAVMIEIELAKAAAWLKANPANKKSNYARFLTNWLSKVQDNSPRAKGAERLLFNPPLPPETPAERIARMKQKGLTT